MKDKNERMCTDVYQKLAYKKAITILKNQCQVESQEFFEIYYGHAAKC